MIDTTHKTNNRGRPLGFANSVDDENMSILTLMTLLRKEGLRTFHFVLMCLGFTHEKNTHNTFLYFYQMVMVK